MKTPKNLMCIRSLILLFPLLVSLQSLAQTTAPAPIESSTDTRIPENLRQKLAVFQFTEANPTCSGVLQSTQMDSQNKNSITLKYDYRFTLIGDQVVGELDLTRTVTGFESKTLKINVEMHKMLQCCKLAGKDEQCFPTDDQKDIAEAEKNGCTTWYRKVAP